MVSYAVPIVYDRCPDMSRATARACANLAFVKYWGKRDAALNLPLNNSISMTLDAAHTTTRVEIAPELEADEVWLSGAPAPGAFTSRVVAHLERIRSLARSATSARVHTDNNFPTGTGFASSASGFAALTCAASAAFGLRLSRRELSVLARKGSGSSCRSIHAGFVEWHAGQDSDSSFATQLADARHWNLVDLAVLVTEREKTVPSSDGHRLAGNSPFWHSRTQTMAARLAEVRQALLKRDFHRFGREVEAEALEMHAIMQTSATSGAEHGSRAYFTWRRIPCALSKPSSVGDRQAWRSTSPLMPGRPFTFCVWRTSPGTFLMPCSRWKAVRAGARLPVGPVPGRDCCQGVNSV